jgi:hypothetical protein
LYIAKIMRNTGYHILDTNLGGEKLWQRIKNRSR